MINPATWDEEERGQIEPTPAERYIRETCLNILARVDDNACRFILCRTPAGQPVSIIEWTRTERAEDAPDFTVFLHCRTRTGSKGWRDMWTPSGSSGNDRRRAAA
jgi:hypothetical protein